MTERKMQIWLKNAKCAQKYTIDNSMPNSSCITQQWSISMWKTIVLLRQEREKPKNLRCRAIHISSLEDLPDHCKELVGTDYKKYSVLYGYWRISYPSSFKKCTDYTAQTFFEILQSATKQEVSREALNSLKLQFKTSALI